MSNVWENFVEFLSGSLSSLSIQVLVRGVSQETALDKDIIMMRMQPPIARSDASVASFAATTEPRLWVQQEDV